ncbi:hypothetical protein LYSHEL_20220 [Lysobacter helvus]|uniref:PAS domain-containing protein n=2 Tax=Lysobacteraceae TaxID=32033 RepID=A0ABN6FVM9_9GAMM|nr:MULTISPECIES: hypothetical protein [Lysobacter]BCT92999.1 hypothetical protein LYSCAS_20230 [Lysobacter caseinilyticus]BCT96151.1 hypothetical protein LYSHEL_20220 [Lysobacter helvus]
MDAIAPLAAIPKPLRHELDRCPWRNPSLWATWRDRVIDDVPTSFAHLWPFDMQLTRPARTGLPEMCVDIRVVFDCHVVTERYDPAKHGFPKGGLLDASAHLWFDAGGAMRLFHADRYALSKALPALILGLVTGATRCFAARRHNYMVWRPHGTGPGGPHYQVFFDLYRTNEPKPRLVLYVQSAYLKDRPLGVQREKVLVFATVCAATMGLIGPKTRKRAHKR